jgi:cysteine-rich repeat protein
MGAGVLSCDALGAAETFEACSARAECSGSSFGCSCASGNCMTRVCVPASTRCAVTGFQTCSADGLSWGNVTGCAVDETCVPALGTCAPVLCTANSRECMTDVLVVCDATGTVRTTTNCAASSQICTGAGPSAACTARVCVPGSLACNAGFDSVLECDARGASLSSTACPSGDYCSAGGCVAEVCTPGSLSRCLAGDVRQCNAIGSAYQLLDDCTASETCVENAGGGTCVAHVCTPSALSCTGDDLVSCAANGLSQSTTDCQSVTSYCSAGACVPWVCTPGSVDCTGTGGTALRRTCNARGSARTQVLCGGILGCNGGNTECATGCGDGVMQGGEECDDGNAVDGDACSNACLTIPECNHGVFPGTGYGTATFSIVNVAHTVEAWIWIAPSANNQDSPIISIGRLTFTRRGAGDLVVQNTAHNHITASTLAGVVTTGVWHHVAYVYTGGGYTNASSFRYYVDGVGYPANTFNGNTSVVPLPTSGATTIGREVTESSPAYRYMTGRIRDLRVSSGQRYMTSFTPAVILGTDGTTLAHWPFSEGAGTTTTNTVNSAGNATLVNVTWGSSACE